MVFIRGNPLIQVYLRLALALHTTITLVVKKDSFMSICWVVFVPTCHGDGMIKIVMIALSALFDAM